MDLQTYDKMRWLLGPLERGLWYSFRWMFPRYDIAGLQFVDARGEPKNAGEIREMVAEAMQIIAASGERFRPLVLSELAFVAVHERRDRISRPLRAYFWHHSHRATSIDLALGFVSAASFLEQARGAGRSFDHVLARARCEELLEEFASGIPDGYEVLERVRRWRDLA